MREGVERVLEALGAGARSAVGLIMACYAVSGLLQIDNVAARPDGLPVAEFVDSLEQTEAPDLSPLEIALGAIGNLAAAAYLMDSTVQRPAKGVSSS